MGVTAATDLVGWTPIRATAVGGDIRLDWCHTEGLAFDDPFFAHSVERALRHPYRLLFRQETSIAAARELVDAHPGLRPAGFVFHLSRCGSTLVSRVLGSLPQVFALSEPEPLDVVLRAPAAETWWAQAVVGALAQPRRPEQVQCVVKLDAWTVFEATRLREAFPDVPWVFLYREPVEVLVSQLRQRGSHVIPGAISNRGSAPSADAAPLDVDEYAAFALGQIADAAVAHAQEFVRFVDYADLPEAIFDVIAPAFGIEVTPADREAAAPVLVEDAKNPVGPFVDDSAAKQRAASEPVRRAAERWIAPAVAKMASLGR
jgi:hypothetical protein